MKFVLATLALVVVSANAQFGGRASAFASFNQPPYRPFKTVPFPKQVPKVVPVSFVRDADSYAQTLKSGSEANPDGSYNYYYETSNGIAAQEQGVPRYFGGNPPVAPVVAQGSYSYTSPEGKVISISYVADENGFQPQGDAIPTPPPVPPQIARALEYIARTARTARN